MMEDQEGQEIIKKGKELLKSVPEILDDLNKPKSSEPGDKPSQPISILDNLGQRVDPKLILTKDPEEEVEGYVSMSGAYDSGIACAAMAARTEYKSISLCIPRQLGAKFKDVPGSGRIALQPHEIMRILYERGILARQVTCQNLYEKHPSQGWRSKHANAIYEYTIQDLQAYILLGGKAILGVPGHEDKNMIHWIYCEGSQAVFDPYPIKADRYKALNSLMIADAIIVGGVPSGAK